MKKLFRKALTLILMSVILISLVPTVHATVGGPAEAYGLGHLLKGFNALSTNPAEQELIGINLKYNLFKSDTYTPLYNYLNFERSSYSNDKTVVSRSVLGFAKELGLQESVTGKLEINLPKLFKISVEQKFGQITKENYKNSLDSLFYQSLTWRREAVYTLNYDDIPRNVIQEQLNPAFLSDLLNTTVTPAQIFNKYGTHILTQYTLGGWLEAGIFSTDEAVSGSVSTRTGLEGTITSIKETTESYNTSNYDYYTEAKAYGGYGGLTKTTDPNAVTTVVNNWVNSFNKTDFWNVCEIVTMPGSNVKFMGVWELIPDGYRARYNELVQYYLEKAAEQDEKFLGDYAYKNLTPIGSMPKPDMDETVLISTPTEFNAIRNHLSGKYVLTNDISLSGYAGWEPIGTEAAPFTGSFYGNGYTISGLNAVNGSAPALFGFNEGLVESLSLKDSLNRPSGIIAKNSGEMNACYPNYPAWSISPVVTYTSPASLPPSTTGGSTRTVTDRRVLVDMSGLDSGAFGGTIIHAADSVDTITFRGTPGQIYSGFDIAASGNTVIIFENFKCGGGWAVPQVHLKGANPVIISTGYANDNAIEGMGNFNAIRATGNLTIYGNSDLLLGHAYHSTMTDNNGGDAVNIDGTLNVSMDATLTVKGGEGRNGSAGVNGSHGTKGANGAYAYIRGAISYIAINGDNGNAGSDAVSAGAAGGNGGNAIIAENIYVSEKSTVSLYGGKGGNGGKGGDGGNGGDGGDGGRGLDATGLFVALIGADGGNGGNGGYAKNGGNGGGGGSPLVIRSNVYFSTNSSLRLEAGAGGNGGAAGKGGNGGKGGGGGDGGDGGNALYSNGRNGGKGGNGGSGRNGSNGGNGGYNGSLAIVGGNSQDGGGAAGVAGALGTAGAGGSGGKGGTRWGFGDSGKDGANGTAGSGGTVGTSGTSRTQGLNRIYTKNISVLPFTKGQPELRSESVWHNERLVVSNAYKKIYSLYETLDESSITLGTKTGTGIQSAVPLNKNYKIDYIYDFSKVGPTLITVTCSYNTETFTGYIPVMVVEPEVHTVQFIDWNGTVLKETEVTHGSVAFAPSNPTVAGNTFTGWNKDFSFVTGDMIIQALYQNPISTEYEIISVTPVGQSITVKLSRPRQGTEAVSVALYKGGRLIDIVINTTELSDTVVVTSNKLEAGVTIKAMWWNDINAIKPLCAAK